MRRAFLEACCLVVKLKFPAAEDIVGIATESGLRNEGRSEDASYCDARQWNESLEREAKLAQEQLGIMRELRESRFFEHEYPEDDKDLAASIPPNPRNKPCPCGSGKKYKRCHGK